MADGNEIQGSAKAEQTNRNEIAALADKADALADSLGELRDDCRDLAGSLRAKAVEA